MSYGNIIFTIIFTLEMLIKMAAFGFVDYFKDVWNKFDSFVVVISWVGVAIDFGTTQNLAFVPLLRILRVVRILKLVKSAKGLQVRSLWHGSCMQYSYHVA